MANVLSDNAVRILQQVIDDYADFHRRLSFLEDRDRNLEFRAQWEGKLTTALAVGGSATLEIYLGDGGDWGATGDTISVNWPSGVGVAMAVGDYLRVEFINGEWRPATGTC